MKSEFSTHPAAGSKGILKKALKSALDYAEQADVVIWRSGAPARGISAKGRSIFGRELRSSPNILGVTWIAAKGSTVTGLDLLGVQLELVKKFIN